MGTSPQPRNQRFSFRGTIGLLVAIAVVAIFLIWLPVTRWFFAISVLIGVVVAGILYLWHRYKPVKPEDVDDKRPLKLDG